MNNNQLENTQKQVKFNIQMTFFMNFMFLQVQEVVGVMRNNIDRVLERDTKLHDLDHRANNLVNSSAVFQQSSRRLKKKYWWQ